MSITTGHHGATELPERRSIIERAGENPLRFLNISEADTALGIIRRINNLERLAAWRDAEIEFFDPPRAVILDACDAREADLTGEMPTPTETVDPDPVPVLEPEPAVEPTPSKIHPDAKLEREEVLVVRRGATTEYVTPNGETADDPYTSRLVDDDTGTLRTETDLSSSEVLSRLKHSHERVNIDDVEIDANSPGAAAFGGAA